MPKPTWKRIKAHWRWWVAALYATPTILGWEFGVQPQPNAQLQAVGPNQELSPAAARALQIKFEILSRPNPGLPNPSAPVVITEVEANSYLRFRGYEFLPAGVYEPEVHINSEGIVGAAEVDFDELNKGAANRDELATRFLATIFKGRQKVSGTGVLETGNGQGKLRVKDVKVGTMAIPDLLVELLVEYYVKSRYSLDLSRPFALPPHVTHIELAPGRATFHRNLGGSR